MAPLWCGSMTMPKSLWPNVLSTTGSNGSLVSSEMTLSNRGTHPATLDFTYTAAFGGGSGAARDHLPAGRQRVVPDAIHYLRQLGVPIPESGNRGGTLTVRFSGLNSESEGAVAVRTTRRVEGAPERLGLSGNFDRLSPTGLSLRTPPQRRRSEQPCGSQPGVPDQRRNHLEVDRHLR